MIKRQKEVWILWRGLCLFIFMCLFPPVAKYHTFIGDTSDSFGFLFHLDSAQIDFGRLFVMWFLVTTITIGSIISLQRQGKMSTGGPKLGIYHATVATCFIIPITIALVYGIVSMVWAFIYKELL